MNFYPPYAIEARWGGRYEASAEVGARLVDMTRRLNSLAPAKTHWRLLEGPDYAVFPLSGATAAEVTAAVKSNIATTDTGEPDPDDGYVLVAIGSGADSGPVAGDDLHVSGRVGSKSSNLLIFQIGDIRRPNNFRLVTYPIYKGALEVMAEVWPCPWAFAYTYDPTAQAPRRPFETAWMAYLSAPLARGLTPPRELAAQRTPGGGLVLSAVERVIDPDKADDLRRSLILTGILRDRVGRAGLPGAYPPTPARQGPY